jgi:hypothetical protein
MDHESYFTVESNASHPSIKDVKFIRKTKVPAKVLLWLADSESGITEQTFFKGAGGLVVNKEVNISKYSPILHKFIQKQHKRKKSCLSLIWRLHTTQRIRWSD